MKNKYIESIIQWYKHLDIDKKIIDSYEKYHY